MEAKVSGSRWHKAAIFTEAERPGIRNSLLPHVVITSITPIAQAITPPSAKVLLNHAPASS
jgi:hypothetical protein